MPKEIDSRPKHNKQLEILVELVQNINEKFPEINNPDTMIVEKTDEVPGKKGEKGNRKTKG